MANRAPRRGRGRPGGFSKPKPTFKWSGLQVGSTDVPTTGVAFVLVGGVEIERYGKCTVMGVRGWMEFANSDSDAANGVVRANAKLMKLQINDAGTLTGDDQAIDTNEEDIAKRQLWTYQSILTKQLADGLTHRRVQSVEVRVKVVLGHPKEELVMLCDSSASNRLQVNLYLRALLKLP